MEWEVRVGQLICDQSANSGILIQEKPKIQFYKEKHARKERGKSFRVGVKKMSGARGRTRGAENQRHSRL